MSEAGYTLTETLAAMAVIGLAIGSFSLGMQVLGHQQNGVGAMVLRTQDVRAAQTWLERRLSDGAPFRTADPARLSGDASGFRFDCAAPAECSAQLEEDSRGRRLSLARGGQSAVAYRLPSREAAHFVYRGAAEVTTAWPPTEGGRQSLRSISLLQGEAGREQAVFEVRIRTEQPLDCKYDTVMQDCR